MDKEKKIIGNPNAKTPAFVSVYESLYEDIKNGLYEAGSQLPPEVKLAEKYNVSRNTLRQALAILNEDGLIYNAQGKGNFISQHYDKIPLGFEKLDNPIFTCSKFECDEIQMDYHFEPPTRVIQEKLNISSSEIIIDSNNIYSYSGRPISHSFMAVPVKFVNGLNIDLNVQQNVYDFLNKTVYEISYTSFTRVRFTFTEEEISKYLEAEKGTQVIFIEEILYNSKGEAIALCKYYLLPDQYNIHIIRKK